MSSYEGLTQIWRFAGAGKMKTPFRFLAHAPLGVVIASGALVLGLSEEPAARPLDGMTFGKISQSSTSGVAGISSLSAKHDQSLALAADAALIRAQRDDSTQVISHSDTPDLTGLKANSGAPSLAFLDPSVTGLLPGRAADIDRDGLVSKPYLGDGSLPGDYALAPVTLYDSEDAATQAPVRLVDYPTQMQNISKWLARYYRRDAEDVRRYVRFAYQSGARNGVDPLLITAVMSIESSLNPKARSHKDARGLMQVLVRVHTEKFKHLGGTKASFEPRVSIEVGTRILRGMIDREGSVEGALKRYVGAANLRSDGGYGAKVIRQRDRIWAAAHGLPIASKPALKPAILRANLAQAGSASRLLVAAQ